MKVLLKQDVKNVGKKGEIIEAKEGFARNFIFPNGLGIEASSGALKQVEQGKAAAEKKKAREREEASETAKKMEALNLVLRHKAGDEGRLFGSVTNTEIAEGLKSMGFNVEKKKIHLDEPIRFVGMHQAVLKLHPDVTAHLNVAVEKLM